MLAEQPRPHISDGSARLSVRRLDDEVALGVEPHGAVGEIARADAEQGIVDDHQLGMNEHLAIAIGGVCRGGDDGIVEPQPMAAGEL